MAFGAGGGPLGGLGAFAQAFMQAQQLKQQRQRDEAEILHQQNQDHIQALDYGLREGEYQLARRKSGVDVHLDPKQEYVDPKATPDQLQQHYRHLAAIYAAQGADDQATRYENMARDQGNEILRRTQEAERFQLGMDRLTAQSANWSQQHKDRVEAIRERYAQAVMTGQMTQEDALIRANAAIQIGAGHDAQSNTNNIRNNQTRRAGYENQVHLEQMRQLGQDRRMRFKAINSDQMREWTGLHTSWNQSRVAAAAAVRKGGNTVLPPGWTTVTVANGQLVDAQGHPVQADPSGANVIKDASGNPIAVGPPEPISPPKFIGAVQASIDAVKNAPDPQAEAQRRIKNVQNNQSVPAGMKPSAIRAIQNAAKAVVEAKTKALKKIPAPQPDYSTDGGYDPYGGGSDASGDPPPYRPR